MECIDLTDCVIKILRIYFSYNKKLEQEKNLLNHIVKIQNILKLWKLRNLSVEGRIVVFKSLVISKLIHLALVTEIPTSTTNLLIKVQIEFAWKGKKTKIQTRTLCKDYENGELKKVDIFSKVIFSPPKFEIFLFDCYCKSLISGGVFPVRLEIFRISPSILRSQVLNCSVTR